MSHRPRPPNLASAKETLKRWYHQYKPKERTLMPETPLSEHFAAKDILLFRYEDPRKIIKQNLVAGTMLPLWTWLSYTCYNLKSDFAPYKETLESSDRSWVYRNVEAASRGVSVAFLLFGTSLSLYWLSRNMNTVRRLVLRKGGKHVTIVTYGLFGVSSRHSTVPIQQVSQQQFLE